MDKHDEYRIGVAIGAAIMLSSICDLKTEDGRSRFIEALSSAKSNSDDNLDHIYDGVIAAIYHVSKAIKPQNEKA